MALEPRPAVPQASPEVRSHLHGMGLSSDALRDAVRAGHDEAVSCTKNDVLARPNWLRWATPYRYLGDKYVPAGWTRERPKGVELLVSPDCTIAIGVAPGDRWTGIERDPITGDPRMVSTRIDRGPLTGQVTVGNHGQIHFAAEDHPAFAQEGLLPSAEIWLLLHYWHEDHLEGQDEIRLELSVPVEFCVSSRTTGRGSVTRFDPRLILPPIEVASADYEEDHDEGDEEIDVEVGRR